MVIAEGSWVDVRWYEPADLAALQAVHEVCYPHENWKKQDFVRFADKPGQVVYTIVREDSVMDGVGVGETEVIGSLLFAMSPASVRLRRVAVLPAYRRQKIGSFAVRTLTGPNSPIRRGLFVVRVREHNVTGQLFLRHLEFAKTETDFQSLEVLGPSWSEEGVSAKEDAYWFRLETPDKARRRRTLCRPALLP